MIEGLWSPVQSLWPWRSTSYIRLRASITTYSEELNFLHSRQPKGELQPDWFGPAQTMLKEAERALEKNDTELGWRYFNAARRRSYYGFSQDELKIEATQILKESSKKLGSWRLEAVKSLLCSGNGLKSNISPDDLSAASLTLSEHFENNYYKMKEVKQQLIILAAVALIAVLLLIAVSPPMSRDAAPVQGWRFLLAVAIFGVMGASISGILAIAKDRIKDKIPEQILSSWITFSRLVVGAVAALAVYAFLASGILNLGHMSSALVLAVSFAAGFSERLVVRAVEMVSGESDAKENDKGKEKK